MWVDPCPVQTALGVGSQSHRRFRPLPRVPSGTLVLGRDFPRDAAQFRLSRGPRGVGHRDQRIRAFENSMLPVDSGVVRLGGFYRIYPRHPGGFCFPHFAHPAQGPPGTLPLSPLGPLSACPADSQKNLHLHRNHPAVMLHSRWGPVSGHCYVPRTCTPEPGDTASKEARQGLLAPSIG